MGGFGVESVPQSRGSRWQGVSSARTVVGVSLGAGAVVAVTQSRGSTWQAELAGTGTVGAGSAGWMAGGVVVLVVAGAWVVGVVRGGFFGPTGRSAATWPRSRCRLRAAPPMPSEASSSCTFGTIRL